MGEHTSAHNPHSMQTEASRILGNASAAIVRAWFGHTSTQSPHAVHRSAKPVSVRAPGGLGMPTRFPIFMVGSLNLIHRLPNSRPQLDRMVLPAP